MSLIKSIVKLDNLLYHHLHSPLLLYLTLFTLLIYMLAVFKFILKTKHQFLQPFPTRAAIYIFNTKFHNLLFKHFPQLILYYTLLLNPCKYSTLFFNLISNPQFKQTAQKHITQLYASHIYYMLYLKQTQLNPLFIFIYIMADRYSIPPASNLIHCNCHPEIYVSSKQTTYSSIHSH